MSAKHSSSCPDMKWECMDMTDLKYDTGSFDVVIDKAAMDAIMVDEGDVWNPDDNVIDLVDKMCSGIDRVLHPFHGVHLQISFAQPHFRTKYLMASRQKVLEECAEATSPFTAEEGPCDRYHWVCAHQTIECGGCLPYYLYLMKRS